MTHRADSREEIAQSCTIEEIWKSAVPRLRQAGVAQPVLDARLLIGHALGVAGERLLSEPYRLIDDQERARIEGSLKRREKREPVAKIIGFREFWSLPFEVGQHTLDPRPDSEVLIEAALAMRAQMPLQPKVLDLGTGTGCLLLSLLHEWPGAEGIGIDIDPCALFVASRNAENLGISTRASFVRADWGTPLNAKFNLVLINPPYIETRKIPDLAPEITQYETSWALDGGPDGLAAYRKIAAQLVSMLEDEGRAVIEIGDGQEAQVGRILTGNGLRITATVDDLTGATRCICAAI